MNTPLRTTTVSRVRFIVGPCTSAAEVHEAVAIEAARYAGDCSWNVEAIDVSSEVVATTCDGRTVAEHRTYNAEASIRVWTDEALGHVRR